MTVRLPYIVWRDGRPRFVPPGHVRALGFKGQDLRHAGGSAPWFTYEEAKAWADSKLAAIKLAREGMKPVKAKTNTGGLTVGELLEDWLASDRVRSTRPHTRRAYAAAVRAMMFKPDGRVGNFKRDPATAEREAFSLLPIGGLREPELMKFLEYVIRERGLQTAHCVAGAFSSAYNWATTSTKWRLPRHLNPRTKLRLPDVDGRISVITPKEFTALVAAADALGEHSIGDSLYLGLYTGQRQEDRLALREDAIEDGYLKVRQLKTGEVVRLLAPAPLKARWKEAAKRRRELMLRTGTRHDEILLNEDTGAPWAPGTYRRKFRKIRREAAKTVASVKHRTDQDLRDTAVTMLHRSGADIPTICEVTGHSYKSVDIILKHYLGRDPKRAGVALERMADFIEAELA